MVRLDKWYLDALPTCVGPGVTLNRLNDDGYFRAIRKRYAFWQDNCTVFDSTVENHDLIVRSSFLKLNRWLRLLDHRRILQCSTKGLRSLDGRPHHGAARATGSSYWDARPAGELLGSCDRGL